MSGKLSNFQSWWNSVDETAHALQRAREFTMTTLEKIRYQSSILVCVTCGKSLDISRANIKMTQIFSHRADDFWNPANGRRQIFAENENFPENFFSFVWCNTEMNQRWDKFLSRKQVASFGAILTHAFSAFREGIVYVQNAKTTTTWRTVTKSRTHSRSEMKYLTSRFCRWAWNQQIEIDEKFSFSLCNHNRRWSKWKIREKFWLVKL